MVVNKIAAGEVIERPASVLKELLENAIDAGARRVDVDVEQGGVELIRVVDDGCGIHADDLPLAFATHATSKLHDADDLFRIGTLGFRGEALASIGGVAQVSLQSRPPDETVRRRDHLSRRRLQRRPAVERLARHAHRGQASFLQHARPPQVHAHDDNGDGTYLRSVHAAGVGARPSLRPFDPLHLTLRHNNKPVHELSASMTLLDRIGAFFGLEVGGALYAVDGRKGDARLTGYIADPSCERGTAKMQYLFVNGRWIRDRSLGHAVQEAYRGLLMTGRYAVAFLFLDLPPDQVDVNVHPTKAEVRFRDSQSLYHLVFGTVRDRLRAENLTARLQVPSTMRPTPVDTPSPLDRLPWTRK